MCMRSWQDYIPCSIRKNLLSWIGTVRTVILVSPLRLWIGIEGSESRELRGERLEKPFRWTAWRNREIWGMVDIESNIYEAAMDYSIDASV